jgi:hypothetical protein
MTISTKQVEKYRELRERGFTQNEARRVANIGRTKSWALDRQLGLSGDAERRGPLPRKTAAPPEDTSEIEDHVREQERTGVIPEVGHGPDVPELTIPLDLGGAAPRRGSLLFFQSERGTLPVRELGTPVDPDDAFPMSTSGHPHSAVRVRVGVESPSDIQKFARLESHR